MTDICKVCLKSIKRSDRAILCDHFDNWITTPVNLFHHNELFHLIKNLNNLTDESSNDDTNSLIVTNKCKDPEYFCNLPGNKIKKSLNIPSQCLFSFKKFWPTPCTSDKT